MTTAWPKCLLRPQEISFEPAARTRSGGVSISGIEPVIASTAGVWRAVLGSIPIRTREQRRTWRAMNTEGAAATFLVPYYGEGSAPPDDEPFSDETLFSDDTGFRTYTREVYIAAAALRATQVTLTVVTGAPIEPGEHFSIGERLYRITSLVSVTAPAYTVKIWPPLRDAIGAEFGVTHANFDTPACRMRLASDDAMGLTLDLYKFGSPSVSLVEAL